MKLTIRRPDDFHVHLRRGEVLKTVLPFTARWFGRALIMPNTNPPILTAADAEMYHWEIDDARQGTSDGNRFDQLMSIQLTDTTTPGMIEASARNSPYVVAGKVYPKGVTTNSHNGVSDFGKLFPVFEAMEEARMLLLIHGQKPDAFCLDREAAFLDTLIMLAYKFPKLRIVMEHLSTKAAVKTVRDLPENVAGTITAHHLQLTLHDLLSYDNGQREGLNPHHYCQPIVQRPEDRDMLIQAAISGNPKFFFGSDTAPHLKGMKECDCGCAGVFTAPVILPVLAEVFEARGALDKLEDFVSVFGAQFYRLDLNKGTVTLQKQSWTVPLEIGGIVPYHAGKTLPWSVVE